MSRQNPLCATPRCGKFIFRAGVLCTGCFGMLPEKIRAQLDETGKRGMVYWEGRAAALNWLVDERKRRGLS
jgi:hypothetical protein